VVGSRLKNLCTVRIVLSRSDVYRMEQTFLPRGASTFEQSLEVK
jgi:hypothetical protein